MDLATPVPFPDGEITLDPLGYLQGAITLVPYDSIPVHGDPVGLISLLAGTRGPNFARGMQEGIVVGKVPGYWSSPYPGIITAVILNTNQGGYTVKFWKAKAGRTPTANDSISKNGYTINPPSTNITIFDLSDFTTLTVATGDTFASEIVAVTDPPPTDVAGNVVVFQL